MSATLATTMKRFAILAAILAVAGCQIESPPDPNDPMRVSDDRAHVIQAALSQASLAANARVYKGEITDRQAGRLIRQYAAKIAETVDLQQINPPDAWIYGQLFITARNWKKAKTALQTAVHVAPNDDRFVNDSLRLAQTEAVLGEVGTAIYTARATFGVPREEKAPILPAILLTIYPVAMGKGYDLDLAKLLEDAIKQHEQVIVDPKTDAGKLFLLAKPHHIEKAKMAAAALYTGAGRPDLAARVRG